MLTLKFEGWVQIRLATDPDPCDEPRGVSGWTFALAGEPDLDRVIRLSSPVAPRAHGPQVGVTVRAADVDGNAGRGRPLVGAQIDLLDGPKFEGRNGLVAEDALELIDPFHIRIARPGLTIERRDILAADASGKELPIFMADRAQLQRRQPVDLGFDQEVADATGMQDPEAFFAARRALVAQDLERTRQGSDATAVVALTKRLAELDAGSTPTAPRQLLTSFRMVYTFDINGPATLSNDHRKVLGGRIDTSAPWPISFWVGGWDCDALCAYMRGTLAIPFTGD